MIPLTHCFGWTKGSRDEQKNWMKDVILMSIVKI